MIWYDNWTGLGDLYTICIEENTYTKESTVLELTDHGEWNIQFLQELFPQEIVQHIVGNIKPPKIGGEEDKPFWALEVNGSFLIKSAWNYIRHKEDKNKSLN